MAEQEIQERIPTGPQFSEAVASFLYDSLNDATRSLVVRLKNPLAKPDQDADKEDNHTPPSSEHGSDGRRSLFNVPYARNPNFGGRLEALRQLLEMWRPGGRGRIAVVGLGGIGKTELMVEFTYRLQEMSPRTPIYWFRSVDLLTNLETPFTTSSSATGMQLDQWLKLEHSPESLVIADPAESFQDLQQTTSEGGQLLDKLKSFKGTVVVLGRDAQSGQQFAGPHGLCALGELEAEASTTLLRGRLGPLAQGTPAEIEEVARLMAYLPRAILQVARLITVTGMTVAQLLQMYKSSYAMKLRLFGKVDRFSNPDQRFSVTGKGVVDVRSFRGEFVEACKILYQLYFLGGDSVPLELFSGIDPLDMDLIMFILKGHLLVREDETNSTYTTHPLVYLAIHNISHGIRRESDQDHIKEEREWFEEIVTTFSGWYPGANSEDRDWWRKCFTQVLGNCDLQINALRLAIAKIHRKESAYFKQKGRYNDALRMTLLAKNILSVSPSEHLSIAQEQITLLDLLGRYRDIQTSLKAYPTDEDEQIVLWKKRMQARLEQAEGADRYESAVSIFHHVYTSRKDSGNSKADLLQSIDDYGWVLMLQGRYMNASSEFRAAFAGRTASFGISHVDTLSSFHNLASITRLEGRYKEALQYAQQSIRGRENVLGVDHPDTLQSKVVKARVLLDTAVSLKDFDDVETLLVDSSNRLAAILSESHPIIMSCRSDRALIMLGRGKYEAAEQVNTTTLSSRQQGPWMEPTTHPDTLASKHQLAELLWRKEGCKAANSLTEEVFLSRTDILTNGTLTNNDFHPDQLHSLQLHAIILSGLREHEKALEKINIVISARHILLDPKHPDLYNAMSWKGEILRTQLPLHTDRYKILDEIDTLHRQALDGLTAIFGAQHHYTLQCTTHQALAKSERGELGYVEAADVLYTVYRGYCNSVGEGHPETLKARSRLADAVGLLGGERLGEARSLWRGAVGGLAGSLGVDAYLTRLAHTGYERFLRGSMGAGGSGLGEEEKLGEV